MARIKYVGGATRRQIDDYVWDAGNDYTQDVTDPA